MAPRTAATQPKRATTDTWKTEIRHMQVNEGVLAAELRARGIDTKGTTEACASRLERALVDEATTTKASLAKCDKCGGKSLISMVRCPYCGDTEPVVGGDSDAVAPPVEGAIVIAKPVNGAANDSDEEAVAFAASVGIQPSDEQVRDLDTRIAKVKQYGIEVIASYWDLGNELRSIHDGKLWLNRRLPTGGPAHRTFAAFAENEIGLQKKMAYDLVAIATYFSREQALAVGISKLRLLVHVPNEGERAQLLNQAQDPSTSTRTLRQATQLVLGRPPMPAPAPAPGAARTPAPAEEDEAGGEEDEDDDDVHERAELVADLNSDADASVTPALPPKKAPTPVLSGKPEAPAPAPKRVTVTADVGTFQMHMYARPAAGKAHKKGERRRAHTLDDQPRGEFEFANGAKLVVRLCKSVNGIYAVCEMLPSKG